MQQTTESAFSTYASGSRGESESLTDEAIIDRVKSGDLALFELIMRRYNQRIYRVVRSLLSDDDEAEDIVQEAYVRAYEHLTQFEGRAKFSTWLTKIAIYEALTRRRKQNRMQLFDPSDSENMPMLTCISTNDKLDETSMSELRAVLASAVDDLPPRLRVVFTMRVVEGLDSDETAECLDLTAANVKVRLHRARTLLRKTIDKRIGTDARKLYQFDGPRCDRIVEHVMMRLGRL